VLSFGKGEVGDRLKERYPDLTPSFVAATVAIYEEIVLWRERHIRLPAVQFTAIVNDTERMRSCLIYLLAKDLTANKEVPILSGLQFVPELGGRAGWVYLHYAKKRCSLRK
jgi:hypothetical protein